MGHGTWTDFHSYFGLMQPEYPSLIGRAVKLLYVIARCDVEMLEGHRSMALRQLHELELLAKTIDIPDLYAEVAQMVVTST